MLMPFISAYLGLGSNLGNKRQNLLKAINLLNQTGRVKIIKQSRFYKIKPVGVINQPDFLNAVIKIKTNLPPRELLKTVKKIEREMGRLPGRRWGPRLIDIDILLYGDYILTTASLTIPHRHLHKRDFVLKPLCEIAPRVIHPLFRKTAKALYKNYANNIFT